jgi:hypothetical protein
MVGLKILSPSGNSKFTEDEFLVLKETIERIGCISKKQPNIVNVIGGVLVKNSEYRILHFKEGFINEGKESTFNEKDLLQRNYVAILLEQWGLCKIDQEGEIDYSNHGVTILKHSEKDKYIFKKWYKFGSN